MRNESSVWSVPFLENSLKWTFLIRRPRIGIQCSGNWKSMTLPVSKWTWTCLLPKLSTKAFISAGVVR